MSAHTQNGFHRGEIHWLFISPHAQCLAMDSAAFLFSPEMLTFRKSDDEEWCVVDAATERQLRCAPGVTSIALPSETSVMLTLVLLHWAARFPPDFIACYPDGVPLRWDGITAVDVAARHDDLRVEWIAALMRALSLGALQPLLAAKGACRGLFSETSTVSVQNPVRNPVDSRTKPTRYGENIKRIEF